MPTARDRFWVWGHPAGSHNGQYNLVGQSAMTPVEGAHHLGVGNLIMVAYGGKPEPPFDHAAAPMKHLDKLVWSIIGDAGTKRNDQQTDLDHVLALARTHPNLCGAMMDDFFYGQPNEQGAIARYSVEQLHGFADRLHGAARPLDLWVVLYDHNRVSDSRHHLAACDVVTFWTWKAENLVALEANLDFAQSLAPRKRLVLGCYVWDYGGNQPMPLPTFQRQCELGLRWLKQGRIHGMIFLATCVFDLKLETVAWLQHWLEDVNDTPVPEV